MGRNYPEPFTTKTLERFIKQLAEVVNRGECLSILNLAKRDQLYRIKQIQRNQNRIKAYLKNSLTQIVSLDLTTESIEDKNDIEVFLHNHLRNRNHHIALFVLDADSLMREKSNLLPYFETLYHAYPHFSILYLFQKNITLPLFTQAHSAHTTLFQNVRVFPLFSREDSHYFISNQLAKKFDISPPTSVINTIVKECGGYFWLIKQAVRHYVQTKNTRQLFTNEGMMLRLEIIWSEFLNEEKEVLKKIVRKDFRFTSTQTASLEYLLKTKLLKKAEELYSITVPLIESFIQKHVYSNTRMLTDSSDHILINDINVNSVFSRRERNILKYFIKNKNKIINRETIGTIFWGQSADKSYTDWALDQLIKRLRRKLLALGLDPKIIQTKKNQGYIFENSNV